MKTMRHMKMFLSLCIQTTLITLFLCCSNGLVMADSRESLLSFSGELYFENSRTAQMWTRIKSKKFNDIGDVHKYLLQLNEGDFNDWRLPTKQELYDLFTIFDLKNNGAVKISIEGKYWLMDEGGAMTVGVWEIGDGCGPERNFSAGEKGYVMAIRP